MKKSVSSLALIAVLSAVASPAFAGKPVIRAVPKTVNVKFGKSEIGQVKTVEADIQLNQIYSEWVREPAVCSETICQDLDSDGSKGDWKGYFNVPKSQKPRALAAAIKGVGETTAERIIEFGYFTSKPRSWSAFSREINSAQRDITNAGYSYNFADNVLSRYGYENAQNLGYYSETSCTVRKYDCSTFVEREREEFYKFVPVSAKVIAHNLLLQSFEQESFDITLNHIAGEADVSLRSGYHRYSTPLITRSRANETTIELNAIERVRGKLPVEAVTATVARDAKGVILTIHTSPQAFTHEDNNNAQNTIRYDVCQTSWIGTCYKVVRSARATPLKNVAAQTIRLDDGEYKPGSKYFVRYSAYRSNSKFYGDKYNNEKETSSIKY